jgi:hypothetical protein
MKSKQLANVLINVLGFYICLLAIPSCVSGILYGFSSLGTKTDTTGMAMRMGTYAIGAGVQAAVGVVIIIKSRKIAGFWFKAEDE